MSAGIDAALPLTRETLRLPVPGGETLALHRFRRAEGEPGEPVLFLHGSVENGRIFYSPSLKGLAPLVARSGFDAYVLDFRGRGESVPHVSRRSRWGQFEQITIDIPAALEAIEAKSGRPPRLWVAHSWGGVLASSFLARNPRWRAEVAGVVCFGTKRNIRVRNRDVLTKIDLGWNSTARVIALLYGYLPGKTIGIGSDDESRRSHEETRLWIKPGPWIDPRDGFDCARALKSGPAHPPLLHVTGVADTFLGHPDDVRRFAEETGASAEFLHLSKANGHRRDYGHIDMLIAPEAVEDHFPRVIDWMSTARERRNETLRAAT